MAPLNATVCSGNPHKLEEVAALFPGWELDLLAGVEFPDEDGATYLDNARIKARYGRLVGSADRWMLADDSGIELAALGGGPGVLTARWAEGRHVDQALAAVDGADRRARYVCELVALSPDGREVRGTGTLAIGNARTPLTVGKTVMIPVNVEHRIDNGSKTAQLVFEGFMIGSAAKSVRYKMTEGERSYTPGCPH